MSPKETRKNYFGRGWKLLPTVSSQELCKVDWLLAVAILGVLFLTYVQGDLYLTGNRSFLMYHHLTDFYKASYEQSQNFYANYLPSTFIAYAIWNLPLYLTGRIPDANTMNSLVNTMWYKLLPVILFFVTAHLIYKIGMLMGFQEKKAQIARFAFIVCPMAVFSQFIFSQYDIFTVFFIVAGLYFYLRNEKLDMYKAALLFGVATTFKYQAAAYFLVLLVLREKKIRNWIKYGIFLVLPFAVEVVPNLGSVYFMRNVFGFNALGYVASDFTLGAGYTIRISMALAAFLLAWAYIRHPQNREEEFSWGLYLCSGLSFVFFGLGVWHPQWLLLMVPFLVLSVLVNAHGNFMVMLQTIFIVVVYMFGCDRWGLEGAIQGGILKHFTEGKQMAITMSDVYHYTDYQMLGSCIFVIILVLFVFNHPRFHTRMKNEISKNLLNQIRIAFLVGVAAFVIPSVVCMASTMKGNLLFVNNGRMETDMEECFAVEISKDVTLHQSFTADGNVLKSISVCIADSGMVSDSVLQVVIRDSRDQKIVYEGDVNTIQLYKDESMRRILNQDVAVEPGVVYDLELSSPAENDNCIWLYAQELGIDEENEEPLLLPGEEDANCRLVMTIRGADTK